jgi:Protein of unknown function (DUF5672)
MNRIFLPEVTLFAVDCIDVDMVVAASEVCQKHIEFGSVKILSHLPSNCANVVKIEPIVSIEHYSWFLMKNAYSYIDTKYALIFQADGFILNPFAWKDEFLEYDYIGAPWFYGDANNVGNGGFCLRTRKLMQMVALDDNIAKAHPEDHFICRVYGDYLKEMGFSFAPDCIASAFSVEDLQWSGQFGFHKADISKWEIEKFTDPTKHSKYIDMFYQTYKI